MTHESRRPPPTGRSMRLALILVALLALVVAAGGIYSRVKAQSALRTATEAQAVVTVAVTTPLQGAKIESLVLPGDVLALTDTPIYARTSGYLKRWTTEIGTRVKAGQLLAEIDTPEVDQQLRQAQADLATAEANFALAESTAKRWRDLRQSESVTPQELDEKVGDAAAKKALVAAARANVQRLRDLQNFKRVVAPFDGVITTRNTQVGDLIAPPAGGSAKELFRLADVHRMRTVVNVPEPFARSMRRGGTAAVEVAELPGRRFDGTIAHLSDAIDPVARTLRVEVFIDNASGELFPGAYARVHFALPADDAKLRLPVNTLIFSREGAQVATVDGDDRIALKKIAIGRDFGTEVEIESGLAVTDRVVVNPPDAVFDRQSVRVVTTKADSG